jgi:hypothetical protein
MRCACRANARLFQLENVIESAECPCLEQEPPLASAEKYLFRLDRGGALDTQAKAADRKRSILPSSTLIAMSSAGSYQRV